MIYCIMYGGSYMSCSPYTVHVTHAWSSINTAVRKLIGMEPVKRHEAESYLHLSRV